MVYVCLTIIKHLNSVCHRLNLAGQKIKMGSGDSGVG
jgi:hypothetical protein